MIQNIWKSGSDRILFLKQCCRNEAYNEEITHAQVAQNSAWYIVKQSCCQYRTETLCFTPGLCDNLFWYYPNGLNSTSRGAKKCKSLSWGRKFRLAANLAHSHISKDQHFNKFKDIFDIYSLLLLFASADSVWESRVKYCTAWVRIKFESQKRYTVFKRNNHSRFKFRFGTSVVSFYFILWF